MEDYKEMINERIQEDPEFARELLKEAAALFLNGEAETAFCSGQPNNGKSCPYLKGFAQELER